MTQTVEVTGSVPMVDSQTVTLGGTLDNSTINDLPLNGRNFINLLSLRPGVAQYPGGGAWTQAGDGLRVEDVNWVVDGLDNNESNQGKPVINSPGTCWRCRYHLADRRHPGVQRRGKPQGGMGLEGGSAGECGTEVGNQQHSRNGLRLWATGCLGREELLQHRRPNPPLNFEQWGGTAGGPIRKDKLFYFGGFEEQRYVVGGTNPIIIPTSAVGSPQVSIPVAEAALGSEPHPAERA